MPQIGPKIIVAALLLIVVVFLAFFGEFLLPLAIILIPIVIIYAVAQIKKNT